MKNKGLCVTCAKNKDCAFTKKFPVWECEEFGNEARNLDTGLKNRKSRLLL